MRTPKGSNADDAKSVKWRDFGLSIGERVVYHNDSFCVCCGEPVPEGRWVCPMCELKTYGERTVFA